jgi:hypothetical protein
VFDVGQQRKGSDSGAERLHGLKLHTTIRRDPPEVIEVSICPEDCPDEGTEDTFQQSHPLFIRLSNA